jgi:hypothetical protein
MIWLTWRQHRAEVFAAVLLLAILALVLVATGLPMRSTFHDDGIRACLSAANPNRAGCGELVESFRHRYVGLSDDLTLPWLLMLPALAGMFFGAPLFGREFEHGTWRLAWTQSVTRARWLYVKLAALAPTVAVLATVFTIVFAWWRRPLDELQGRFDPSSFSLAGPSFPASTLFAFALGALAGVLLRRTVAAIAVTLVAYAVVRLGAEQLRPHYRSPLVETIDPVVHESRAREGIALTHNWVLDTGWIGESGERVSATEKHRLIGEAANAGKNLAAFLHERGIRNFVEYQPANRYWDFQLIETGLFLALAAVVLACTVGLVSRRTG